jgi:hypothetical protein
MRLLVLFLALLAGAKVWTQHSLFKSGAEEALIAAYADRARQACQRQPALPGARPSPIPDWARTAEMHLATGLRDVDVRVWQVDHELWASRYRNPILVVTPPGPASEAACEYDILADRAYLSGP